MDDNLTKWCKKELEKNFFIPTNNDNVMSEYKKLMQWVNVSKQYDQKAKDNFMRENYADAFLVSYAMQDAKNTAIVTQEVSKPYCKHDIKLPDACKAFNIRSLNLMELFKELKTQF